MSESTNQTNNFSIPIAIIIAGALLAGAVYFSSGTSAPRAQGAPEIGQPSADLERVAPVTSADHIRGNPDAPVVIIEYSDFECPFCKAFHPTMQRVVREYGDQVAWVYRHFPLDQLHPVKARKEAIASECAAELGGNGAFWAFADRFFELTPSNNQTDIDTVLPQIAREIGLNAAQFSSCLEGGKFDTHVNENIENAIASGGTGTPWSIAVTRSGKKYPISGAQPYEVVKQIIDQALREN